MPALGLVVGLALLVGCEGGAPAVDPPADGGAGPCPAGWTGPSCWLVGHEVANPVAYADRTVSTQYQQIQSESSSQTLAVRNYAALGPQLQPGFTGTVEITGGDTNYLGCGLCVFGYADERMFMAESGSVQIDALPAEVGERMQVTLRSVVMREILIGWEQTEVPDGERWKLDGVTLAADAGPFPCPAGVDPGAIGCGDTSRVECVAPNARGAYAHIEMIEDCVQEGRMCIGPTDRDILCAESCTTPGDLRCSAGAVERCYTLIGETGTALYWIPEAVCTEAQQCVATGGAASCVDTCSTSGALRCYGDELQRCDGTTLTWQLEAVCVAPQACDAAAPACR